MSCRLCCLPSRVWRLLLQLYEASGNMVSTTRTKAAFRLPQGCSWEQYMALQFPEDKCEQVRTHFQAQVPCSRLQPLSSMHLVELHLPRSVCCCAGCDACVCTLPWLQEVISPFSGKAFSSGSGAPGKRRQVRGVRWVCAVMADKLNALHPNARCGLTCCLVGAAAAGWERQAL